MSFDLETDATMDQPVAKVVQPETQVAGNEGETKRRWLPALLLLLTLGITAGFVARGITTGEFSINVDETVHACSGLFVASFLRDLPLRHPVRYTYSYYAHYPTLGLIEYPPVFYVAEGVIFRLFGPSVVTARITVLLFALLGAYFLFRTVSYLADEWTAAICTLLVGLLPEVLLYEKSNMLDLPALALGIAAAYYWIRFLREEKAYYLYAFAVCAVLELLTKQQSIYLLLWCALTLTLMRKWRLVLNHRGILTACLCAAVLFPYYFYTIRLTMPVVLANVAHGARTQPYPYVYYLLQLPQQIGWPLLVLSVAGIAGSFLWGRRENDLPMLLLIAACFLTETAMSNKVPRYIIYWIPPLAYFAVLPFTWLRRWPVWGRVAFGFLMTGVLITETASAWSFERPYVSGYTQLAHRLLEEKQGIVLADVMLPGDLAFFVGASDPGHNFIINRKALFVTRNVTQYGAVELAHTNQDVRETIQRSGIKYIVVEQGMTMRHDAQHALRDLLAKPQFKLLADFPMNTNDPGYMGHHLLLYQNLEAVPPSIDIYRVKMLTLDGDIEVPMTKMLDGSSSK